MLRIGLLESWVIVIPIVYLINITEIVKSFDSAVYDVISGQISPIITYMMKLFTFLGSELALTALALLILLAGVLFKRGKYFKRCLFIGLNVGGGALLVLILKNIVRRPRPNIMQLVEIGGYSFPSGHSMSSLIFYGFLIYLALRYIRNWTKYFIALTLALLILLTGISRIYLGVHYASDVLGGYIIGTMWLFSSIKLFEKLLINKKSKTWR